MTENMRKLLEIVSKDEALTAKIGAMGMEEILALAKELGIELTEADLEKPAVQELDDDDLDTVAGGSDVSCACAMGGGGTKDDNDKTCACAQGLICPETLPSSVFPASEKQNAKRCETSPHFPSLSGSPAPGFHIRKAMPQLTTSGVTGFCSASFCGSAAFSAAISGLAVSLSPSSLPFLNSPRDLPRE